MKFRAMAVAAVMLMVVAGSLFAPSGGSPRVVMTEQEALRIAAARHQSSSPVTWRARLVSSAEETDGRNSTGRPRWVVYGSLPGKSSHVQLTLDGLTGQLVSETLSNSPAVSGQGFVMVGDRNGGRR